MSMKDILQEDKPLLTPEIRVWVHPKKGSDYHHVFPTVEAAMKYIKRTPRAERKPLIAWGGYEWTV